MPTQDSFTLKPDAIRMDQHECLENITTNTTTTTNYHYHYHYHYHQHHHHQHQQQRIRWYKTTSEVYNQTPVTVYPHTHAHRSCSITSSALHYQGHPSRQTLLHHQDPSAPHPNNHSYTITGQIQHRTTQPRLLPCSHPTMGQTSSGDQQWSGPAVG